MNVTVTVTGTYDEIMYDGRKMFDYLAAEVVADALNNGPFCTEQCHGTIVTCIKIGEQDAEDLLQVTVSANGESPLR